MTPQEAAERARKWIHEWHRRYATEKFDDVADLTALLLEVDRERGERDAKVAERKGENTNIPWWAAEAIASAIRAASTESEKGG